MARLSLFLLGPPLIELDGRPAKLGRHKALALLAYLALTRRSHHRDALATMLWPDLDQSAARAQLRGTLSMLNQVLGSGRLIVDRDTVEWASEAQVSLDVDEFRRCLAVCAAHGHPPQEACAECLPSLAQAVELYRDGFLAGFTLPDAPAFDEWQFFETEGLRDALAGALQRLVRWHGAQGEHETAIPYARRWLALDPLHEPAHRALMELYARSGQHSAALRQYGECQRAFREELDVAPTPETVELYEAIRTNQPLPSTAPAGTAVASEPPAAPKHNLPTWLTPFIGREDLLAEIQQCLQDPACRLLTLVGPGGSGKTRLAVQATAREVDRYAHGVWFVSLAAIQPTEAIVPAIAAAIGFSFRREGEPRGQLLDYLRQKRMLLLLDNCEHLLSGVDVVTDILQAAPGIKALVTSRVALNVGGEQLLPVPGMSYPNLTPSLPLGTGPNPSPEGRGEVADAAQYSAVQLFVQAAQRVRPGFEPTSDELGQIVELCQLVQGMPLALLLAAAWMRPLSPAEIVTEVRRSLDFLETDQRDLPERQRSVRAVFDHSWRLLTEQERVLFPALAMFRGGFTRQAAQEVAGAHLRALVSLVNKSFLQRDQADRYQVHELLRQYGQEKLDQTADAGRSVRDRHSAYFCAALERWAAELKGPRQRAALAEMDLETDNARVAWDWAVEEGHWAQLAQAAACLDLYYDWRSHIQEAETAFRQAAERLSALAAGPRPVSGDLLCALVEVLARQAVFMADEQARGQIARRCQDLLERPELAGQDVRRERALVLHRFARDLSDREEAPARSMYQDSLTLYRELSDRWSEACLLRELGGLEWDNGEVQAAGRLWEESLVLFRALGEQKGISSCLWLLHMAYGWLGRFDEAEQTVQEQMALARQWDDRSALALGFGMHEGVLWMSGRFAEAAEVYEQEYLPRVEELGDRVWCAFATAFLGRYKLDSGDYASACAIAERSLALGRALNSQTVQFSALPVLAKWAMLRERYAEARQLYQETLALGRGYGAPMVDVWYRGELAVAALRLSHAGQARQDLCDALRIAAFRSTGTWPICLLPPAAEYLAHESRPERAIEVYALALRYPFIANSRWQQDVFGKPMAAVAAALPPEVVAAARARGRALDLQATVQELLQELESE